MSVVDSAISRLAALALACSSSDVTIKFAPEKPVDDATTLPLVISHIISGQGVASNSTTLQFEPVIAVDFHFSRISLRQAYTEINAVVPAYMNRLAGDPTLSGSVDTIQFPVTYEVTPADWDKVTTQMLRFSVSVKTLETPVST
jgi:hypothetical protein